MTTTETPSFQRLEQVAAQVDPEIVDHIDDFLRFTVPHTFLFWVDDVFDYLYEVYGGPKAKELVNIGVVNLEAAIEYHFGSFLYGTDEKGNVPTEVDYWVDPQTCETIYKRIA